MKGIYIYLFGPRVSLERPPPTQSNGGLLNSYFQGDVSQLLVHLQKHISIRVIGKYLVGEVFPHKGDILASPFRGDLMTSL